MQKGYKHIKFIIALCLVIFVISSGHIQNVNALPFINIYSQNFDTTELDKMTVDDLKKAAMPFKNNILSAIITGDTENIDQKLNTLLSQDTNIYVQTSYVIVPSTATTPISVSNITTYYKFIGMIPAAYPQVNTYIYYWQFKDGVLQSNKISIHAISSNIIYKQASDGTAYPISNINTYTDKRLSTVFDMADDFSSNKLNNVCIATASEFADSLASTVLAYRMKAPILFMNTKDDTKVYDYVNKKVSKSGIVYILGQEGAISKDIANKFSASGYKVKRLGGANRYDTCIQINNELNTVQGTPVVIVNGENYPDALSISSIAAAKGYPILLTKANDIPQQTISALEKMRPSTIYVIGGSGAISDVVCTKFKIYSANVIRIDGNDRYETSMNICKRFSSNSTYTMVIATGEDFKDAIAGSIIASKYNSSLLLVNNDVAKVKQYLDKSQCRNLIILGDTNSISSDVQNALKK